MSPPTEEVAANPKRLGAEIGFLCVLHTWGQTLMHHPHIHCVVPAGGFATSRARWCSPSAAASSCRYRSSDKVFRGKVFTDALERALPAEETRASTGSLAWLVGGA